MMKEVTCVKGMRLAMLSNNPTATATSEKLFKFSSKKFGSLKKVLTFAAAIEKKAKVL
ncbi:MAG: hypothetical protein ACK5N4_26205 [Parabacteroides gordonii]|uniref:hypothetical protein n=1 Tax=Parabacteroides gordonii TaxID=574930 RepID=UPI003A844D7E